jgi:transcriptional antiterminator RfaH
VNWFLIYTKPRFEIKLSKKISELGIEVFCPTYKTLRQWSDRKKKVELPLFSSYIFVRLDQCEPVKINWLSGFSHFVYWLGKPVVVRDQEITSIKLFLDKVVHESIKVNHLVVGKEVQIGSGPFKKVKGKVLKIGKKKAVLQIDTLGSLIEAELSLSEIIL